MNKKTKYVKPVKNEIDRDEMLFLLNNNVCLKYLHRPQRARKVWEQWREKIMPVWIDVLPGSRCWAFWAFDTKEHRKAIQGVSFFDRRSDILPAARRYAFGLPTGTDFKDPIPVIHESEADFLKRHNLLTDTEKAMPIERLRQNSCDFIKRYGLDLAPVEAVLTRLGF